MGLPFVALSALAPGLQRLFSAGKDESAADPYYLYAASNLGSTLGLLGYPLLAEPLLALGAQSLLWAGLYLGVGALCIASTISVVRQNPALTRFAFPAAQEAGAPISWRQRGLWLALAAVPASLISGISAHITTDIAPVPMLWVAPLALYLATHILAFARSVRVPLGALAFWQPFGVAILSPLILMGARPGSTALMAGYIAAILAVFFVTALICHTRLARSRPPAGRLTEFYFILALGGALGGAFNAFIAPLLFPVQVEFIAVLLASLLLLPAPARQPTDAARRLAPWGAGIMVVGYASLTGLGIALDLAVPWRLASIVLGVGACLCVFRPPLLALGGLMIVVVASFVVAPARYVTLDRNFFGVSAVRDRNFETEAGPTFPVRQYQHGSTLHGMQVRDPALEAVPTLYYAPDTTLDSLFSVTMPGRVLVMGMGTGSTACYTRLYPDATIEFAEIDSLVHEIAQRDFTYLALCPPGAVHIGDGRLVVETMEAAPAYDLMTIDVFSSDAVPAHIITREALEAYRARMRPNGVIAVHVSNRYLTLRRPLAGTAAALGLRAYGMRYDPQDNPLAVTAEWVALTGSEATAARLEAAGWLPLPDTGVTWTDDHANLLSALKLGGDGDFDARSRASHDQMQAFTRANRPVDPPDYRP